MQACASACLPSGGCSSACLPIELRILRPKLVLSVNGVMSGATLTVPVNDQQLRVEVKDASFEPITGGFATYTWTCSPSCSVVETGAADVFALSASDPDATTFDVTVERTHSEDSRVASFAGTVVLVQGATVLLSVGDRSEEFDVDESVYITAVVDNADDAVAASGRWSCAPCSDYLAAALLYMQSETDTIDESLAMAFSVVEPSQLKLNPNMGDAGSTSVFWLTVTDPVTGAQTESSIKILFRQLARCATFTASSTAPWDFLVSDCAGVDRFQFGFVPAGTPLVYGVVLAPSSSGSLTLDVLPPGDLVVFCYISGTGSMNTVQVTISVPVPVDVNVNEQANNLDAAVQEGDLAGVLQDFSVLNSFIDIQADADAAAAAGGGGVRRALAQASAEVIAARADLINQLPAMAALLEDSAGATLSRLGYASAAVAYPEQVSLAAANAAAAYTLETLTGAAGRNEVLLSGSGIVAVQVCSHLALSQTAEYVGSAAVFSQFVDTQVAGVVSVLSPFAARALVPGEAAQLFDSSLFTLAVANVSAVLRADAYVMSGVAVPSAATTVVGAPDVTVSLASSFGATAAAAAGGVNHVAVSALIHAYNPHVGAVDSWAGATLATPVVSVRVHDASFNQVALSDLEVPITVTLPMVSGVAAPLGSALQCMWFDTVAHAPSRQGCASSVAADGMSVTCFCDRTGDVFAAYASRADLNLWPTAATTDMTSVGIAASEASSAASMYRAVLTAQPLADVTVTLSTLTSYCASPSTGEHRFTEACEFSVDCATSGDVCLSNALGMVTPSTLTFTSSNWNTPQQISYTVFNDDWEEGAQTAAIKHVLSSLDVAYDSAGVCVAFDAIGACSATVAIGDKIVPVTIADNDAVSVVVSMASLTVAEGGASSGFSVSLSARPLVDVTVSLDANLNFVTLSQSSIVFTPLDYEPVAVTVTAVDDTTDVGVSSVFSLGVAVSASGADYAAAASRSVAVTVTDNDVAAFTLSATTVSTSESDSVGVTYTVVLESAPMYATVITLTAAAGVTVTPSSLEFTRSMWAVPMTVRVVAVDDTTAQGDHDVVVTHMVASADTYYNALTAKTVTVSVTDNDNARLVVAAPIMPISTVEGTSSSYELSLGTAPTASVTLDIAAHAYPTGAVVTRVMASPSSVVFTAADWFVPQTVTLSAEDNSIAEAAVTQYMVGHTVTTTDATYSVLALAAREFEVNVLDNDVAGIVTSMTEVAVSEAGATSSVYTLQLSSQPVDGVSIAIAIDAGGSGQLTVSPAMVSFTAVNWNTPVSVTVTAVNDRVVEGTMAYTLTHTPSSTDAKYSALGVKSLPVSVGDDDVAGVTVTVPAGGLTVQERDGAAASMTYTVVLTNAPQSVVTVTPSSSVLGMQFSVSPAYVEFSPSNWNEPKSFVVTRVADDTDEGTTSVYSLSHTVTSAHAAFAAVMIEDVSVTVVDDDVAAVTVEYDATGVLRPFTMPTRTASIRLGAMPSSLVTVTLAASSSAITVSPSVITFSPGSWNVNQMVTFTLVAAAPVSDTLATVGVTVTPSSSDTMFGALSTSSIVVKLQGCSGCDVFRWVSTDFSACSKTCGGGVSTRTSTCKRSGDNTVSANAAVDCAGQAVPESSRVCNTRACKTYAFVAGAWGACDQTCGGSRQRTVACYSRNFDALTFDAEPVDDAMCGTAAKPTAAEACAPCPFCVTSKCSGHGACNAAQSECVCEAGFSGALCHVSAACAGAKNKDGACCGANSVLDASEMCCVGSAAGVAPALDKTGACCASGEVNACGVCDGAAAAVVDALGECCASGVTDADGECCASGLVDAFQVCDGTNASGKLMAVLSVQSAGAVDETALEAEIAAKLSRPASSVNVVSSMVGRRVLSERRQLLTSYQVTVELLPYGGANYLTSSQLSSAMGTLSSVTLVSVVSTSPAGSCNNGVCEIGERPNAGASIAGCPADCSNAVLTCPKSGDLECNAVGTCVASATSSTTGAGVCSCRTSQGYLGAACELCAAGFVSVDNACVRVAPVSAPVVVSGSGSSSNMGLIIGAAVGGAIGLGVVVGAIVFAMRHRREKKAGKSTPVKAVKAGEIVHENPAHKSPKLVSPARNSPTPQQGRSSDRADPSFQPQPVRQFAGGDSTRTINVRPVPSGGAGSSQAAALGQFKNPAAVASRGGPTSRDVESQ
jgi:hypothetical protein